MHPFWTHQYYIYRDPQSLLHLQLPNSTHPLSISHPSPIHAMMDRSSSGSDHVTMNVYPPDPGIVHLLNVKYLIGVIATASPRLLLPPFRPQLRPQLIPELSRPPRPRGPSPRASDLAHISHLHHHVSLHHLQHTHNQGHSHPFHHNIPYLDIFHHSHPCRLFGPQGRRWWLEMGVLAGSVAVGRVENGWTGNLWRNVLIMWLNICGGCCGKVWMAECSTACVCQCLRGGLETNVC